MATGRIGVTPTLGTRWSKAPAGGTTSLSGLDDNSVSLVYSVGYEQVYRNGVLLSRGNDYTATTGNSITLIACHRIEALAMIPSTYLGLNCLCGWQSSVSKQTFGQEVNACAQAFVQSI